MSVVYSFQHLVPIVCIHALIQSGASLGSNALGWYLDWCLLARERFHAMYLLMVDKMIHHCHYCGDFDTGAALVLSALQFDGAREKTHRLQCCESPQYQPIPPQNDMHVIHHLRATLPRR
jgi:hypothetical protein